MSKIEVLKKLNKLAGTDNREEAHIEADKLLCEFLNVLGYADVVNAFYNIEKWYS